NAVIGPNVRIGANCRIGPSCVVDGWTDVGDDCEIYPFASIGQIPQDLKFHGEETRLTIGRRNIFREFVTIHRGTEGGGGVNTTGLNRRGFTAAVVTKLKRSFRYLLQSKLNTTRALQQIEQDRSLACAEVQYLVDFIRTSQRGVILRRPSRRTEEVVADE